MKSQSSAEFTEFNADHFGCVDGRQPLFILQQKGGRYQVEFNINSTEELNYPQLLGAALGFVAAVEKKLGLNMHQAFNLVEQAFKLSKFKPSIHVDDHHGHLAAELQALYDGGNSQELVGKILSLIKGCGFAAYQWESEADYYIKEAISRGWIIQVLTGEHQEAKGGAYINYKSGQSYDVIGQNKQEKPAFNFDVLPVQMILGLIQDLAREQSISGANDFSKSSFAWLLTTYQEVVVLLKGVEDKKDIKRVK